MKGIFITSGIIVALLAVGALFYILGTDAPESETGGNAEEQQSTETETDEENINKALRESEAVTITRTGGGFSPEEITVPVGTTVVFVNESTGETWPASDVHPTHTIYSGTSLSEHCSDGANDSFDACEGIAPGESYSFTFDKTGTWRFHDHLQASYGGVITVTE